jgi:peptide deformylase
MQIVLYPHPALRWKSSDVTRIDDSLRSVVRQMFDLMYQAKGVGLAANQVGLPLRLFVVNATGEADHAEEEIVFINPVIRNRKGQTAGEEGCLSLPGLYADVVRAEEITVEAYDLEGKPFRAKLDDLGARVVQHETDHLDGVLFVDRLDELSRAELSPKLADLSASYKLAQSSGTVADDEEIREELKRISRQGHLAVAKR